jgi:hypothetical protein
MLHLVSRILKKYDGGSTDELPSFSVGALFKVDFLEKFKFIFGGTLNLNIKKEGFK